ncbi:MAG: leucyl/phenylalanyl-tRNA--protein transferase [Bacteroidetes bacterium]|nr:leucyl/phenylalanyl-tRNA--protein transferase [Bacteroidota bacterium]
MPVFELTEKIVFPDVSYAEEDGLLAVGGDLSIPRLLKAYSLGIFPWYSKGQPILWWSPDPRYILIPEKFHISGSMQRSIRKKVFELRTDKQFGKVIATCSSVKRTGESGTWITADMKRAYTDLFHAGFAHSFESYYNGNLVGGLYGVSLGKVFFGESMFHTMTDASKAALYHLVETAKELDFQFIDVQMETSHLSRLGAEAISREEYLSLLQKALRFPTLRGKWENIIQKDDPD